jgi:AcrR family transcriptional regulator
VTTADLAQAVGITQGAVFRHFESKEAIWLAVIDFAHQVLLARLQTAAQSHVQPLTALRAVFMAHVDFVVEQPGVPRVIFQELQHPEDTALKARVRVLMQDYRSLVTRLLLQAQAAGLLAPGTDLQASAVLFIGSVQGLVMQSLLSGQVGAMAAQAPAVFDLLQQAIAAPPTRARRNPQETPA